MFRSWLREGGFISQRGKHTHLMMDGGRFFIPSKHEDQFNVEYTNAVLRGERLYIVEKKSDPTYNFFVDVDYKEVEAIREEKMDNIIKIICDTVRSKTNLSVPCLVCISDTKEDRGKLKNGIHLTWNGMYVDKNISLNLREFITKDLAEVYPHNDWKMIIDEAVYKGSGLRLPWSYKRVDHRKCKGKGCLDCEGIGKVDEGEYLPIKVVREDIENLDPSAPPSPDLIRMSSIRCHSEVTNVVVEDASIVGSEVNHTFDESQFTKIVDPELKYFLDVFISKNMRGQENTKLHTILQCERFFMLKTFSKFCENLKPPRSTHKSHHVWFIVKRTSEIRQKCFCRCETREGRVGGMCKDFQGTPHVLTPEIQKRFKHWVEENDDVGMFAGDSVFPREIDDISSLFKSIGNM